MDVVGEELALRIEEHDFAAGAKTGIDGEDGALAERGGEEELAQVFGEDADGFFIGFLFQAPRASPSMAKPSRRL